MSLKFNFKSTLLRSSLLWLSVITVIAFGLRCWDVTNLPAQLNRDEAAIAYNAKLLAETGRDEWQRPWPLALESFGDYKLPGYVWLVVGLGKVFGWHDWVVRFPSVMAGSLLPVAVYGWLRASRRPKQVGLWSALLIAVAPFSWFYSRMAFEANVGLVLLVTWLAVVAIKRNYRPKSWLVDFALWLLALVAILTYNTPLLLLPFFLIFLPWLWGWRNWRNWGITWLGLVVITAGGFYALGQLFGQKTAITLFSDSTIWAHFITQRGSLVGWQRLVLGHWWVFLAEQIGRRWWLSWSPQFLVTQGGSHPWHAMPGSGHLYWLTYSLGLVGLATAVRTWWKSARFSGRLNSASTWWLYLTLVSLAPAVITVDAPHATRSLLFFVLLTIWAAEGVVWVSHRFKTKKIIWWIFVSLWLLIEAGWYGYRYFMVYPQHQGAFQPGLSQVMKQIDEIAPTGPVAVVGDGYQYILWAWYGHISTEEFFATVVKQQPDRIGFRYGERVGRYHFIVQPMDRSPQELVLVQWRDLAWQIQTFTR